jgi:outer membrane lipoprotein-sorting protein
MMRLLVSIFLLLLLVETSLAGKFLPNAFEGEFRQEKKNIITKKVMSSLLEIKYSFPNNIYFKTFGDSEIHYICNSSRVWIYTPPFIPGENGDVKVGNSNKFCYSKIFDALSNGFKNNSLYQVKKISAKEYDFIFKAKAKAQLELSKLSLEFKTEKTNFSDISKIILYKVGDKHPVSLITKSLKIKNSLPAELFIFKVPKNTEVTKMK